MYVKMYVKRTQVRMYVKMYVSRELCMEKQCAMVIHTFFKFSPC